MGTVPSIVGDVAYVSYIEGSGYRWQCNGDENGLAFKCVTLAGDLNRRTSWSSSKVGVWTVSTAGLWTATAKTCTWAGQVAAISPLVGAASCAAIGLSAVALSLYGIISGVLLSDKRSFEFAGLNLEAPLSRWHGHHKLGIINDPDFNAVAVNYHKELGSTVARLSVNVTWGGLTKRNGEDGIYTDMFYDDVNTSNGAKERGYKTDVNKIVQETLNYYGKRDGKSIPQRLCYNYDYGGLADGAMVNMNNGVMHWQPGQSQVYLNQCNGKDGTCTEGNC